jgi:hypothetical protein
MEFDTWDELGAAFLGAYGPQVQQEAVENIKSGLSGVSGPETQGAYNEFWDDLEQGLDSGQITWQDGGPATNPQEDAELAAAADRVAAWDDEMDERYDRLERFESAAGRPLLPEEEDALIKDDFVDPVEFLDGMKGKLDKSESRVEIMAAAGRRSGEERAAPVDPQRIAEEVAGMDEEGQRQARMVSAAVLADDGLTYDDLNLEEAEGR